jgi:GT2 family glycosyltransferase
MAYPRVAIVIAVFNGEKYLDRCLQSLMNQRYPKDHLSIIVVDNNSTDDTKAVTQKYPVSYLFEERQGSYAARNTGAAEASSCDALAFFDADQEADPDWLRCLVEFWSDSHYGAFGGRYVPIESGGSVAAQYWREQEKSQFRAKYDEGEVPKLGGGNTLVRKSVFDELGGFDAELISWGDFDFSLRLAEAGYGVKYCKDATVKHFERTTVAKSLKREFRIGYGAASFAEKHKQYEKPLLVNIARNVWRTFTGMLAIIKTGFKRRKDGRLNKMQIILLDIGMKWAHTIGYAYRRVMPSTTPSPTKW